MEPQTQTKSSLWTRLRNYIGLNILGIAGFFFLYLAPIITFGCFVSFTQSDALLKLSVWGYIAVALILVIIAIKIRSKIKAMPHSAKRGVLLSVFTLIFWGIIFGAIWGLQMVIDQAMTYWLICGGLFVIGRTFYILDDIRKSE